MSYEPELTAATQAARQAGAAILQIQADGFEIARKANQDPVTTADLEANRILKGVLLDAFPADGWLSEETRDDARRLECKRTWIIDPVDGTKEYTQAIPEFCISIALVEDETPVVGVIFNPSTDEMFTAVAGEGARCNDKPIHAERAMGDRPLLACSRSEISKGKWEPLADLCDVRPAGSAAWKLVLVARGEVDGTFTMAPRNEWDIAAGVLILEEAGGVTSDRSGQAIRFNQPDPLKNGIVGATRQARDAVFPLVEKP
ncbi:MAG: 3'(2'),5'-bisphosphate nucleotidase CysQ [Planctomycetota bacterium]